MEDHKYLYYSVFMKRLHGRLMKEKDKKEVVKR